MPYSTSWRGRPWRNGLTLALALACLCVPLLALTSTAHAGAARFCPEGNATISLGGGSGCTNSVYTLLTGVAYYNRAAPWHCALGKATTDPGGSGATVVPQGCGYGAIGTGEIYSGAIPGGSWGYARGVNGEAFAFAGFFGNRYW